MDSEDEYDDKISRLIQRSWDELELKLLVLTNEPRAFIDSVYMAKLANAPVMLNLNSLAVLVQCKHVFTDDCFVQLGQVVTFCGLLGTDVLLYNNVQA